MTIYWHPFNKHCAQSRSWQSMFDLSNTRKRRKKTLQIFDMTCKNLKKEKWIPGWIGSAMPSCMIYRKNDLIISVTARSLFQLSCIEFCKKVTLFSPILGSLVFSNVPWPSINFKVCLFRLKHHSFRCMLLFLNQFNWSNCCWAMTTAVVLPFLVVVVFLRVVVVLSISYCVSHLPTMKHRKVQSNLIFLWYDLNATACGQKWDLLFIYFSLFAGSFCWLVDFLKKKQK